MEMEEEKVGDFREPNDEECVFVWDETSQLYFHARSGFYHDPHAGWYYNSRDGLYYKFENGNYVPFKSERVDECDAVDNCQSFLHNQSNSHTFHDGEDHYSSIQKDGCKHEEAAVDEPSTDNSHPDNHDSVNPRPPSEWLEDTLIELYLSGYSTPVISAGREYGDEMPPPKTCDGDDSLSLEEEYNDAYELEEGEWIPEDHPSQSNLSEHVVNEGTSQDEENWQAQYGQVVQSGEELKLDFSVVNLWDWALVSGLGKDGKSQVTRLVGRLVKPSAKLHPSMPAGGGLLKTAPIYQACFDLVRVRTGKVYKLRSPSAGYLASVVTYDSSNPTKDWGFPHLVASGESKSSRESGSEKAEGGPDQALEPQKHGGPRYKDRAAERRALHGGFGVGPGQKSLVFGDNDARSSNNSVSTEDAAAEAQNITFGAGSFARKVLESMGWKEGEGLGSTRKGLVEPLQAVGNIGNAGLGWPLDRTKRH